MAIFCSRFQDKSNLKRPIVTSVFTSHDLVTLGAYSSGTFHSSSLQCHLKSFGVTCALQWRNKKIKFSKFTGILSFFPLTFAYYQMFRTAVVTAEYNRQKAELATENGTPKTRSLDMFMGQQSLGFQIFDPKFLIQNF